MACLPESLQEAIIPDLWDSGYYIPNFLTIEEEAYLLEKVLDHNLSLYEYH